MHLDQRVTNNKLTSMHCTFCRASLFLEEVLDNMHAGGKIYGPGSFADLQVAVTSSDLQRVVVCVRMCVCVPKKQGGRN